MDTDSPKNIEKIVMAVVIFMLITLLTTIGVLSFKNRGLPKIDPNVYQAVLLKDGLQFFGHLKNIDTKNPSLTEVYYLRTQGGTSAAEQNISLIKRGTGEEIYNPEEVLYLNWDNVLFWENLKPKSKVMDAIKQLQEKQASPSLPVSPVPAPPEKAKFPAAKK